MAIDIRKYDCNTDDSMPRRIAKFLIWAAEAAPGEFIAYDQLARAVKLAGRTAVPTEMIDSIKTRNSAVRRILNKDFGKDLITEVGVGLRATVSDDDLARNALEPKRRRLESARQAFTMTVSLIDPRKITDTKLRAYVQRSAQEVAKTLSDPAFLRRLLPVTSNKPDEE